MITVNFTCIYNHCGTDHTLRKPDVEVTATGIFKGYKVTTLSWQNTKMFGFFGVVVVVF